MKNPLLEGGKIDLDAPKPDPIGSRNSRIDRLEDSPASPLTFQHAGFRSLPELDEVEVVPEEEPKPKKYRDEYIIPGSGFRMLVGDIYNLIVLYHSLARRLSEAETEKDFLRFKKRAGNYEKEMKRIYHSLGLPEGSGVAHDTLEEAIIKRHNLIPLEEVEDDPQDDGLEGDEVWSD